MNQPLLSIIVPVYNAGTTLIRCVGSILPEAPANSEIFLVNDGSADNSAALCDGFEKADPRIRVIHQKNSGASAARNAGLAAATGQFIQFVDADDYLNKGLYAAVLPHLTPDLDLLVFGIENLNGSPSDTLPSGHMKSLAPLGDKLEYYMVQTGILVSPVNKLYHRRLIANARFDTNLPVFEDAKFNMQVLGNCTTVWFDPAPLYACDNRIESSLSRQFRTDLLACEAIVQPYIKTFLQQIGLSDERQAQISNEHWQNVCVNQCAILLGRKSNLSFAEYRQLYADILRSAPVRKAVLRWLPTCYSGVARLFYSAAIRLRWHGLLALRSTRL